MTNFPVTPSPEGPGVPCPVRVPVLAPGSQGLLGAPVPTAGVLCKKQMCMACSWLQELAGAQNFMLELEKPPAWTDSSLSLWQPCLFPGTGCAASGTLPRAGRQQPPRQEARALARLRPSSPTCTAGFWGLGQGRAGALFHPLLHVQRVPGERDPRGDSFLLKGLLSERGSCLEITPVLPFSLCRL